MVYTISSSLKIVQNETLFGEVFFKIVTMRFRITFDFTASRNLIFFSPQAAELYPDNVFNNVFLVSGPKTTVGYKNPVCKKSSFLNSFHTM